jgi:hypothetical protein
MNLTAKEQHLLDCLKSEGEGWLHDLQLRIEADGKRLSNRQLAGVLSSLIEKGLATSCVPEGYPSDCYWVELVNKF